MSSAAPGAVPVFHFNTAVLPRAERFGVFHDGMRVTWDVSPHDGAADDFTCDASVWLLGQILVNSRTSSGLRLQRTARKARTDTIDHYQLNLMHEGGWVGETDGVPLLVPPGAVVLLDLARPMEVVAQRNRSVSLTIPRDALDALLPARSPRHWVMLQGGTGGLLADYMASLERRMAALTPADVPFIERATCDMAAACLAPSRARLEQAGEQVAASLRLEAKRVVEQRLHDPRLSPDNVATALGVSRATLYRLFEREGGVAAFMRGRRLRQVSRLLTNPAERRRISEIAFACGFESEAHFSKAFRREFGATPSDVRAVASPARQHAPAQASAGDHYQRWMRHLRP